VRVTLEAGVLIPDTPRPASRRPGRGAYLCHDVTCVARALERDAHLLRRALRAGTSAAVSEELERVGTSKSSGA
jgi:predicted RNA-binding protein YlxR (DUF448 family)